MLRVEGVDGHGEGPGDIPNVGISYWFLFEVLHFQCLLKSV